MLALQVELLTGRYAATAYNDRNRAEWPPHPARFFSALVAALHDREPVDAEEIETLRWLEQQPPPALDVDLSVSDHAGRRSVSDVYVPVNDITLIGDVEAPLRAAVARNAPEREVRKAKERLDKVIQSQFKVPEDPSDLDKKNAVALLPDRRVRQVRTFPVVVPSRSTFSFIWEGSPSMDLLTALDRLCARVTRLGHSSSLVRCSILPTPPEPTLVPAREGTLVLRVVGPGQLDRLNRSYQQHLAVHARILPSRPQTYAPTTKMITAPAAARSHFSDDWIVFQRIGGARPLSSKGPDLAKALRGAFLEQAGDLKAPGSITGHGNEGRPFEGPHVAFISLPFVGHDHADGSVQGVAIVPPRNLDARDRETLLRLVARWEKERADAEGLLELAGPGLPPVHVRREELPAKWTLRPPTWCSQSRRFVTATPIALDRHPGNLRSNRDGVAHRAAVEAQKCIALACERIGLPRPILMEVSLAPLLPGAQPIRHFAPWPDRPGRPRKVRVHADIRFDREVEGPLLLGAGRHFGLGLCLPVQDGSAHEAI